MKSEIYLGLNGINVLLMVKLNINVFPSALKRTKENIFFFYSSHMKKTFQT